MRDLNNLYKFWMKGKKKGFSNPGLQGGYGYDTV